MPKKKNKNQRSVQKAQGLLKEIEPLEEHDAESSPVNNAALDEEKVQNPAEGGARVITNEYHKSTTHRKHLAAVPIGGVFVLLALIGLITVIVVSVQATSRLIDNSTEKDKFENIILPVLMFDPVPFESPKEMDDIAILRSSIWSAIVQNSQKYTFNDSNMVTVPQSDVDVACKQLFGDEVTLKHQAFEDYLSIYPYDEETKMYYVPVDASILYTPQVDEIVKKGDILTLTVGYLAPDNPWMMSIKGEKQEPVASKHMLYELKKVEDHYQLISIKDPPEGAIPGIPQIKEQPAAQQLSPAPEAPIPSEIPATPINPEDKTKEKELPADGVDENKPDDTI